MIERDGDPWFVAKDVASILGYYDTRKAVEAHCKGGVKHPVLTAGGRQQLIIIPERDVYRLIMRSKLPSAERFEEWVVGEVLPQIRKTGGYIPSTPEMTEMEIMARAVLIGQKTIEEQRRKLEAAAPKVTTVPFLTPVL